jgi:hypothetical protein
MGSLKAYRTEIKEDIHQEGETLFKKTRASKGSFLFYLKLCFKCQDQLKL